MQCNSCGSELPPKALNCPNCGTAVFASSPFEKTALSSPGTQPENSPTAAFYPTGSFQEMASPPPQIQPDKPFQANPYPYTPGTLAKPLPVHHGHPDGNAPQHHNTTPR